MSETEDYAGRLLLKTHRKALDRLEEEVERLRRANAEWASRLLSVETRLARCEAVTEAARLGGSGLPAPQETPPGTPGCVDASPREQGQDRQLDWRRSYGS